MAAALSQRLQNSRASKRKGDGGEEGEGEEEQAEEIRFYQPFPFLSRAPPTSSSSSSSSSRPSASVPASPVTTPTGVRPRSLSLTNAPVAAPAPPTTGQRQQQGRSPQQQGRSLQQQGRSLQQQGRRGGPMPPSSSSNHLRPSMGCVRASTDRMIGR